MSAHAPSFSPRASGGRYLRFCSSLPASENVARAQRVVRAHEQRHRRVHARDLFEDDRRAQRVVAGAAVLFRHHDAEQPLLGELRDQLRRKARVLVALGGARRDLAFGELAHRLLEHLLIFAQFEIHVFIRAGAPPARCRRLRSGS